jgi:hypothetical protein
MNEAAQARGNRLLHLATSPGFNDLRQIVRELVQEAADMSADFPGWDAQQIVMLKVRHQCAKEIEQQIFARLNFIIDSSATPEHNPQRDSTIPDKNQEFSDSRIPGSYRE